MSESKYLVRYSRVVGKENRELLLLRGEKCRWNKCRFCDYHMDSSEDIKKNFLINKVQLEKITGIYQTIDIANSGSFPELDSDTIEYIKKICEQKKIKKVICEAHWIYRKHLAYFRKMFRDIGVELKIKVGVETFDYLFRESYLEKGIDERSAERISEYFDRACLLFGLPGQTIESMFIDLETALKYFEHVYVNIMTENTSKVRPSPKVIKGFKEKILPLFYCNDKVEILLEHTDLGIGGLEVEK